MRRVSWVRSALLAMFGLSCTASPALGATLTVCASGCSYTTIQAAVTAATAGDTVDVMSGTYTGPVSVDKQLTLRGDPSGAPLS